MTHHLFKDLTNHFKAFTSHLLHHEKKTLETNKKDGIVFIRSRCNHELGILRDAFTTHICYHPENFEISDKPFDTNLDEEQVPPGFDKANLLSKFPKRYIAELKMSLPEVKNLLSPNQGPTYVWHGKLFTPERDMSKAIAEMNKALICIHLDVKNPQGGWDRAETYSIKELEKEEKSYKRSLKRAELF